MRGAEAVLRTSRWLGRVVIIKERIPKRYRVAELDEALRRQRTRQEARLLHRAKEASVPCPIVLAVGDFSITMTRLPGRRPLAKPAIYRTAGRYLAQLHAADVIHGDYTPANLLMASGRWQVTSSQRSKATSYKPKANSLYVIDFGLGFFSADVEDKAIDVLTMLKSIDEKCGKAFGQGYKKYKDHAAVFRRIEQVKSRVRYA